MRLWHLFVTIAGLSILFTLVREPITRVFLVVFVTGLGEVVMGTTAVLALFQTVGALGEARGLCARVEAIAATSAVLAVASTAMSAWLFAGVWVVAASA